MRRLAELLSVKRRNDVSNAGKPVRFMVRSLALGMPSCSVCVVIRTSSMCCVTNRVRRYLLSFSPSRPRARLCCARCDDSLVPNGGPENLPWCSRNARCDDRREPALLAARRRRCHGDGSSRSSTASRWESRLFCVLCYGLILSGEPEADCGRYVLRLGQRFQSFCRVRSSGIHGRLSGARPGQAALRVHRCGRTLGALAGSIITVPSWPNRLAAQSDSSSRSATARDRGLHGASPVFIHCIDAIQPNQPAGPPGALKAYGSLAWPQAARMTELREPIGGGILAGITHVIRSPVLPRICGFV